MSKTPISQDPKRMSGVPTFSGTRVPVKTLFEYLEADESIQDFLQDFPTVSRDQVQQVLQIAKKEVA